MECFPADNVSKETSWKWTPFISQACVLPSLYNLNRIIISLCSEVQGRNNVNQAKWDLKGNLQVARLATMTEVLNTLQSYSRSQ